MNDTERKEIIIPFQGFYESVHNSMIDHAVNCFYDDDNGNLSEQAQEKIYHIPCEIWKVIHIDYATAYVEAFSYEYDLHDIEFKTLISPKYYNFETDQIICTLPFNKLKEIYHNIDHIALDKTIHDRHTSYDGFCSFYPNSLNKWPKNLNDWDLNHFATLLIAHIETTYTEHCEEHDLIDSVYEVVSNHLPI